MIKGTGNTACTPITNFLADEDFTWSVSGLDSTFCCLTLYIDSKCNDQLLQACSTETTQTVSSNVGSYEVGGCVNIISVSSTLIGTSTGATRATAP